MIPSSGFLPAIELEVSGALGNVLPLPLAQTQRELYEEGPTELVDLLDDGQNNFGFTTHIQGSFSAELTVGRDSNGKIGFRIDMIRNATYGTILIDTVDFNTATISLLFENCPDVTEPIDEPSSDVPSYLIDVVTTPIFEDEL